MKLCRIVKLVTLLLVVVPNVVRAQDSSFSVKKELITFLHRMARVESDNNPRATNRFGMLGKYQFHPHTIRSVGIRTTRKEFLNNEELQDTAMVRYMKANENELSDIIRKFDGKTVRGVKVTKSGILASAHLVGTMGVRSFFYPSKYHYKTKDANGTTVAMYMKKFANYNLQI